MSKTVGLAWGVMGLKWGDGTERVRANVSQNLPMGTA